jgi:hypothetical protein
MKDKELWDHLKGSSNAPIDSWKSKNAHIIS